MKYRTEDPDCKKYPRLMLFIEEVVIVGEPNGKGEHPITSLKNCSQWKQVPEKLTELDGYKALPIGYEITLINE